MVAQSKGGGGGGELAQILPMLFIVLGVMYFMVIRPANKERKQHEAMLDALKRGDEVVTQSGILGKVTDIADNFVTVEIARNVKVRMLRSAIAKKYVEKEVETEAAKA